MVFPLYWSTQQERPTSWPAPSKVTLSVGVSAISPSPVASWPRELKGRVRVNLGSASDSSLQDDQSVGTSELVLRSYSRSLHYDSADVSDSPLDEIHYSTITIKSNGKQNEPPARSHQSPVQHRKTKLQAKHCYQAGCEEKAPAVVQRPVRTRPGCAEPGCGPLVPRMRFDRTW